MGTRRAPASASQATAKKAPTAPKVFAPSAAQKAEIAKLEQQLKTRPDNMQLRERLAEKLMAAKDYKRVIEVINPYTDLASELALLDLASAYHETEGFVDEIRILNSLLIKDEKNSDLYYLIGHAQISLSKKADPFQKGTEEAKGIAFYRKSIDLNPKYKPPYEALMTLFITNDNRHEARAVINDMLKRFPKRPELYNELCRLYSIDGYIEQALQTCKLAIQMTPSNAKNFVYMANAYKDQKETEKAGQLLSNAARKFPNSAFLQVAAGDFYQSQNNHPVATRYFERAVALDPKLPEAHIGLARSLIETGRHRDSYEHFFLACKGNSRTLPEFQEALVKVRQKGEVDLESKFSQGIYACKQ